MTDRLRRTVILATIFVIGWILAKIWVGIFPELWWFKSVKYDSVYIEILKTKVLLGSVSGIIIFLFILINLILVRKFSQPRDIANRTIISLFGELDFDLHRYSHLVLVGLAALFSMVAGYTTTGQWEVWLRYFNSSGLTFNVIDPIFKKDVAYYVFLLPFWRLIYGWCFSLFLLMSIATIVLYLIQGSILASSRSFIPSKSVRAHIFILIGTTLLLRAWGYTFAMYELLLTRKDKFFGAGYADIHAKLPVIWVMLFLCLICGALFFINIFIRRLSLAVGSLLLLGVVGIVGGIYPNTIQQLKVKPNEQTLEKEYIKHNIDFTNHAYNLGKIEEVDYPGTAELKLESILQNTAVMENIRLWDWRPLLQTFRQLQELRSQYDFSDVDIDRYMVNGRMRQVMLASRELDYSQLQPSAQTWVNQTFLYTHGYGVVTSPVNEVLEGGRPRMFVSDIPIKYDSDWSHLLSEDPGPRIYYGEKTNNYVIVDPKSSKPREFDFPKPGEGYSENRYSGDGGVPINNLLRKLTFAWKFSEIKILLSDEITSNSQILFHRHIMDRISTVAPFLKYDKDPYIVISNGKLVWVVDAYTTTHRYPYSEPMQDMFADQTVARRGGDRLAQRLRQMQRDENWGNYIRNSVKVVIDAYNGDMNLYVMPHENDPLIQCYQRIFPQLFKSYDQMPEELKAHIRYPQALFMIQALKYRAFHMSDPLTFYAAEDLWELGREKYGGADEAASQREQVMEPYYVILKLPDQDKEEFLIMIPYTPRGKPNMIAWFSAKCDQDSYGQLLVYQFPKGQLIPGPMQVEAFVDQNPEIAQQITLWDQSGSRVIRGNLLVIPVDDSVLYVEPIYLQSEQAQTSIPELRRVIIGYKEKVVMGESLLDALNMMFGETATLASVTAPPKTGDLTAKRKADETLPIDQLAGQMWQQYRKSQDQLQLYQQELGRLEEMIKSLQKKVK